MISGNVSSEQDAMRSVLVSRGPPQIHWYGTKWALGV
jgi:hypothetical protein